jgi:hypothetical protein
MLQSLGPAMPQHPAAPAHLLDLLLHVAQLALQPVDHVHPVVRRLGRRLQRRRARQVALQAHLGAGLLVLLQGWRRRSGGRLRRVHKGGDVLMEGGLQDAWVERRGGCV